MSWRHRVPVQPDMPPKLIFIVLRYPISFKLYRRALYKYQNDWATEMDIVDEQGSVRFEF